jgi:ABC-type antimicrobial peptide transport system permease subunit
MEKIKLLSRSNFRKNKGTCVGLFLLMMLASMMIGLVLLLFMDAYPTARKEAEKLDAGDGYIWIMNDIKGIDDEYVEELIGKETKDYYKYTCLGYDSISINFGDGTVSPQVLINNKSAFNKAFDRTEVIVEDENVTGKYIYLPYQFYTSGGYEIGDIYELELTGTKYSFTVKGFTDTTYFGCNNDGVYEFVLDDDSYDEIYAKDGEASDSVVIAFKLKEGEKLNSFRIKKLNDILKTNPMAIAVIYKLNDAINGRSFMSLVLATSFLTLTIIIVLVITVMMTNSISNFIKENMQSIGALKAIGYTSSAIRSSLYIMFAFMALLASICGAGLSYALMPIMAKIVVGQMGIPYTVCFNLICSLIPAVVVVIYVLLVSFATTGKVKKIEPIVALREGIENHSFKKNHVRLDRSAFSLNVSLALKNLFNYKKQNIITFFVTGLLVFTCVMGLLMYENFSRNPKVGILTFEICGGTVGFDSSVKEEAMEYLENLDGVSNIRRMISLTLNYNEEDSIRGYIFDDVSKMNNKEVCYKGRLPEFDNEVAVSGKFASDHGLTVGDEVRFDYGNESFTYLITGLIQTCNNSGREGVMNESAAEHLIDFTDAPAYYWFDCDGRDAAAEILDNCSEEYGDHVISSMNFYDTLEGNLTTFRSISALMMILLSIISGIVIMIILYLLIKAFVYNKRKDYGILKALGFTSNALIMQTALSFMPSIILAAIVFSFVSYYIANPYMAMVMRSFGLMKGNFHIPVQGVVIIGVSLVLVAYLFSILQSLRIKKIESYKMLIGE